MNHVGTAPDDERKGGSGQHPRAVSGHVESFCSRKQHAKTFKRLAEEAAVRSEKPVRPFVLYSLWHTFLTRLGQSGCDVWTVARIAGHSSIAISARNVHPSENAVLAAMERLDGHKIGHTPSEAAQLPVANEAVSTVH
jgi:integrase